MSDTLGVREIIQRGGGPKALHARHKEVIKAEKRRNEKAVAEKTIYSWFENGIPEKHWAFVMSECRVTEADLHRANEALRRPRPSQRALARAAQAA